MAYLHCGERKKAMDCFQKCIDITPDMAKKLIEVRHLKLCTRAPGPLPPSDPVILTPAICICVVIVTRLVKLLVYSM